MAESGLLCAKCGTAECARHHGTWFRKRVVDLSSGTTFTNLPIVRLKFCTGNHKSLFPADLWRGKATVSSVLGVVWDAISVGVEQALQRAVAAGDGDEPFSERTLRRWIKRLVDRMPLAWGSLNFSADGSECAAARFENFLTQVHLHELLALRRQWGCSLLDVPAPPPSPPTAMCIKPGFQHPRAPQNPPSKYVRRGARSRRSRRGRSPDD